MGTMNEIDEIAGMLSGLTGKRREAIVDAGIEVFGHCDYQDASTELIARKAGISKGLLFFYFKNKRTLYRYLIERIMERAAVIVADDEFYRIDDFFELMIYAAGKKRTLFERVPWILDFSIRAFYPDHRDVRDSMNTWNQLQIDRMIETYLVNVRFERFRDEVSPRHVIDMLIWLADGYLHQQRCLKRRIDMDALLKEFEQWCAMLRTYTYREEWR